MRPSRVALALVTLGCTAVAAPARAITNGQPDDGDPEVGALLDENGETFCTGTLVAPGAVLTAAHCLDHGPPSGVYFGPTPPALGQTVDVIGAQAHPDYDPTTHAHDLAVVRLAANPAIAAAKLYAMPLDGSAGLPIRIVGFGRASTLDDAAPRKRTGASRIDRTADGSFTFRAAPSQTCFGDSGGPAFAVVGGVEQLVGVTSTGDLGCDSGATDVTVELFDSGFVAGYVAGTAVPPTVVGGCSLGGRAAPSGPGLVAVTLALLAWWARRRRVHCVTVRADGAGQRRVSTVVVRAPGTS